MNEPPRPAVAVGLLAVLQPLSTLRALEHHAVRLRQRVNLLPLGQGYELEEIPVEVQQTHRYLCVFTNRPSRISPVSVGMISSTSALSLRPQLRRAWRSVRPFPVCSRMILLNVPL